MNRLQSSRERLGSELQVGRWLAYRLYQGPKEADKIIEDLEFVSRRKWGLLRRSQFIGRSRMR